MNVGCRESNAEACQRQPRETLRARHQGEAHRLAHDQGSDEPSPLLGISQGNKEQHAQSSAKLGEHGDCSDLGHGDAKGRSNRGQQWLDVIDVRHNGPNAEGHEPDVSGVYLFGRLG